MLRAGVAGVGNLGKLHVSSLLSVPDLVSVDALADPIEEKRLGKNLKTEDLNLNLGADESAAASDVRSYDDYRPLCEDDALDVVVIATPSDLHAAAAILAMESGKHVFTEKPMALNEQDCGRMIDASKANGRTLMVGQCLRFYAEYVAADEMMRSGTYGRVLTATMHRHGGSPGGWFAETERSGGVNLDLHIHDIDAALWWWGKPDKITSRSLDAQPGASSVLSQWSYDDGPEVQIEASWDAGSGFAAGFRIVLEKGTLVYEAGKLTVIARDGKDVVDLSGEMGGPRAELVYFLQCVRDGVAVKRCLPAESALAVQHARH
ncbi:MAG: Gfo/Idh/MocA family oxidoreductase [Verrucomicrobia bacterium]|nr:Gfo/Idh/MocA family oxidoreductase [Verrucomicrobiota bacterium]